MGYFDTAFADNFENDCGMILVGVGVRIACVFKLNDITWTDTFSLPVDTSAPYVSASVSYAGVAVGEIS